MNAHDQPPATLVERLNNEADLCKNDGADDIAALLWEAAAAIAAVPLVTGTPAPDHRPLTVQVGMVRDWAGIYQRKGTELGDTPAGAEALAHSQRYRQLANTLAALQVAVDTLRVGYARWDYIATHWSNMQTAWNLDAGNTLKSMVLTIKSAHKCDGSPHLGSLIDQAISVERSAR